MPYKVPCKETGQSSTDLFQLVLELLELMTRPVKCLQYQQNEETSQKHSIQSL